MLTAGIHDKNLGMHKNLYFTLFYFYYISNLYLSALKTEITNDASCYVSFEKSKCDVCCL